MAETSKDVILPSQDELARDLAACTITPENPIQISQIQHRLNILAAWFGSLDKAAEGLSGSTILEIGCGQGDMTAVLAYFASQSTAKGNAKGRVIAVDPAPLDYGKPYALGDAQGHLSASYLGECIQWVQRDPTEFLSQHQHRPDFIVLAHSLFYLPSADYLSTLLRCCRTASSEKTRLLLAEWGMHASAPEARSHILAVETQMACPIPNGNIRTVLKPDSLKGKLQQAQWQIADEGWIPHPAVDDGSWEVSHVQKKIAPTSVTAPVKRLVQELEQSLQQSNGVVKSMDVWTSVSTIAPAD